MSGTPSPLFTTTPDGQIDIDALPIDWFVGAHRETDATLVQSPLQRVHDALGAHYLSLEGIQWVVRYRDVSAEYRTLKTAAGLLDISVSGLIELTGPAASKALQHFFGNDVLGAAANTLRYGALVDDQGKVLDDCIVYKFSDDKLWLVANAVGVEHLPDCIRERWQAYRGQLQYRDCAAEGVKLQVQGPQSAQVLQRCFPSLDCGQLRSFECLSDAKTAMVIGRCGYSGEDGFEIFVPRAQGETLWAQLCAAGAEPYGIAAVEYCRVETGLLSLNDYLPGQPYPQEIGLGHFVKDSVAGHLDAYEKIRNAPLQRQQWYVLFEPRASYQGLTWDAAPRSSDALLADSGQTGMITSLAYSPLFKRLVGLASFPYGVVNDGETVHCKAWAAQLTTVDKARAMKKRLGSQTQAATLSVRAE